MSVQTPGDDQVAEIRLLGFPLRVYRRAQQHSDELLREFELIAQSVKQDPGGHQEIPHRLLALVDELSQAYAQDSSGPQAQIDSALAAGESVIAEVAYRMPRQIGDAARHLGELFDEADRYCQAGQHLLTLTTPPDLKRFRDWYLGEFIRQASGQPPTPWQDNEGK